MRLSCLFGHSWRVERLVFGLKVVERCRRCNKSRTHYAEVR